VRYLIGITTVSQLVSMISPKPVCLGPITNSFYLSIARGHWQTDSLGLPITTKNSLNHCSQNHFHVLNAGSQH
jgi:hypothetical protein